MTDNHDTHAAQLLTDFRASEPRSLDDHDAQRLAALIAADRRVVVAAERERAAELAETFYPDADGSQVGTHGWVAISIARMIRQDAAQATPGAAGPAGEE